MAALQDMCSHLVSQSWVTAVHSIQALYEQELDHLAMSP